MRQFLFSALWVLGFSALAIASQPQQPAAEPATAQTATAATTSQDASQPGQSQQTQAQQSQQQEQQSSAASSQNSAQQNSTQPAQDSVLRQITVPSGTQLLLRLQAPINTKSAQPGNGVYLQTIFPITIGNTVVIPVGSFVQGTIDRVVRPGKIKGRAQVDVHFTTLIFPNGYTVSLPGALDDVPGDSGVHKKNSEGTIERDSQKGKELGEAGIGAAIGTLSTAGTLNGTAIAAGAGAGAIAGLLVGMLTREGDIRIEAGSQIEMVLQRPLILEERKVEQANGAHSEIVPVDSVRVLEKPGRRTMGPLTPCGLPVCL